MQNVLPRRSDTEDRRPVSVDKVPEFCAVVAVEEEVTLGLNAVAVGQSALDHLRGPALEEGIPLSHRKQVKYQSELEIEEDE